MHGKDNLLQGNLNFLKKNAMGLCKEVRPLFTAETAKSKAYRKQERQALVCPTGFEPAAFGVGVIRPSSRNPLRRKGLVGIAQISVILKKSHRILAGQGSQGFLR